MTGRPALYLLLTILKRRKLLVVHPVGPGVGLDDVVRNLVNVFAQAAEAPAAGREVAGAVPRDRDEERLVESHPHLDLVAKFPETYPVVRTKTVSSPLASKFWYSLTM